MKLRGLGGEIVKGSHAYVIICRVEGKAYFILRWPSVEEVDLEDLKWCPARGLLLPELGELPLIQQMLLFARHRKQRIAL